MKRVFSSDSLVEVGHLKNLLEQRGIHCLIKNEQLSGALGDIPYVDCWPELWIILDQQLDEALTLLAEHQQVAKAAPPWRCSRCGETIEGQFGLCWQCGAAPDDR